MTVTVDIPDFLADDLATVSPEELKQSALVGLKNLGARRAAERERDDRDRTAHSPTDEVETKTDAPVRVTAGAALLKKWADDGVLTGYGDPNIDSPELARILRETAWRSRDPQ